MFYFFEFYFVVGRLVCSIFIFIVVFIFLLFSIFYKLINKCLFEKRRSIICFLFLCCNMYKIYLFLDVIDFKILFIIFLILMMFLIKWGKRWLFVVKVFVVFGYFYIILSLNSFIIFVYIIKNLVKGEEIVDF